MSTQRAAEATSRPGCYEYPTQCNSQQFARYCLGQPSIPAIAESLQSRRNSAAFAWSRRSWDLVLGKQPGQSRCRCCPDYRTEETAAVLWDGHSYLVTNVELATNSRILLKRFRFCAFMPPNNGVPATWARGGRWYGQAQAGRTSAPPLRGTHRPQTSPPRTTRLSKRKPAVPAPGLVGTRIAEK